MEKINKLSLPVTILISAIILGGFYFAVEHNKQRSIEKQQQIKIEQEKQDQLAKELREQRVKEEAEQALSDCIAIAEENYSDRWYRECKTQSKLTKKCIDINELSFDEYLEKYELTIERYVKERDLMVIDPNEFSSLRLSASFDYILRASDECSCRLLITTADRFNESLEKNKAECFKRYPQN